MEYRFTSEQNNTIKSRANWWIFLLLSICALSIWYFGINQILFLKLNAWHKIFPDSVWSTINYISAPKHFILATLLIIISLFAKRNKATNVILAVIIFYVLFALLKHLVGEARPYISLPPSRLFFLPSGDDLIKMGHQSFPSGHTGNAAVFIFSLISMFFSRQNFIKWILIILLVFIMLARVCTGWHWPLDVLVSALIGYLIVKVCLV